MAQDVVKLDKATRVNGQDVLITNEDDKVMVNNGLKKGGGSHSAHFDYG